MISSVSKELFDACGREGVVRTPLNLFIVDDAHGRQLNVARAVAVETAPVPADGDGDDRHGNPAQ